MDLISGIVARERPCYFISPHLDDAILSAGGMILYLAGKTRVEVISVFTRPSPAPYTRFCKKSGYKDANDLFAKRRLEDKRILRSLGVRFQHLGFVDAAWRKKENPSRIEKLVGQILPEALHLYPFQWNFLSGKVCQKDLKVLDLVQNAIERFVSMSENPVIFCPVGIGGHVDHHIVRLACVNAFRRPICWEDFPYSLNNHRSELFSAKPEDQFTWTKMIDRKFELMKQYVTQSAFLSRFYQTKPVPEIYNTDVESVQKPASFFIHAHLGAIFGGRSQNTAGYPAYGKTE